MTIEERKALQLWQQTVEDISHQTPVEQGMSRADIEKKRIYLEAHPLEWIKYFLPMYAKYDFAPFQKKAISRLINNPEWFEVLSWSRELAKSTIVMFCVLFLVLTGKKRNVILAAATEDAAKKLLAPYRALLEGNRRLIAFYGEQMQIGQWKEELFVTKKGVSFMAVGAGSAPRGSRNEAFRPDVLLVDDFDTDEDCRNPVTLDKKWQWWEKALYPTRSVSEPTLVVFCGNIIAKDTCVARAGKMADHWDIINLVDKNGDSTWSEKNKPEDIARIKKAISSAAFQGEYMNNPVSEGKIFKNLPFGKIPSLKRFPFLVCYGDPAYSNKKDKSNSTKAVWLVGKLKGTYYVIKGFLERETNANYIDWFFNIRDYVGMQTAVYFYQENNTLQDPFFQQVFKPLLREENERRKDNLYIREDARAKMDKAARIEAALEPIDREGRWIFNEDEKDNPHMQALIDQHKMFEMSLPFPADGPDCLEGAFSVLDNKLREESAHSDTISFNEITSQNNKRM